MTIYKARDNSPAITAVDRNIPPWFSANDYNQIHLAYPNAPIPFSNCNWCENLCGRNNQAIREIQAGWIRDGTVGFAWTVSGGIESPNVYVRIATFSADTLAYLNTYMIADRDWAFGYPSISPNSRGIGIAVVFSGRDPSSGINVPVGVAAAIIDSNNPILPSSHFHAILRGTHAPGNGVWGDYIRVRPYNGVGNVWIASGFILEGGDDYTNVKNFYFTFGREVDRPPEYSSKFLP